MLLLDASVWIAALNADDSQHQKAIQVFDGILEKILIPEYILIEVINVLVLRMSKEVADRFLQMTLSSEDVEVWFSSEDFTREICTFFLKNPSKKLSFPDQALARLSKEHRIVTFDKALLKYLNS